MSNLRERKQFLVWGDPLQGIYEADNISTCDGELTLIRDGFCIAIFPAGQWKAVELKDSRKELPSLHADLEAARAEKTLDV